MIIITIVIMIIITITIMKIITNKRHQRYLRVGSAQLNCLCFTLSRLERFTNPPSSENPAEMKLLLKRLHFCGINIVHPVQLRLLPCRGEQACESQ